MTPERCAEIKTLSTVFNGAGPLARALDETLMALDEADKEIERLRTRLDALITSREMPEAQLVSEDEIPF